MKKTLRALISLVLVLLVFTPVIAETDNSQENVVGKNSDSSIVVKQEGDEAGGSVSDSSFTALETFTLNAYELTDGEYVDTNKDVGNIEIKVTLKQSVPDVASGYTREWKVFVVHDDKTKDTLSCTVSGQTATFTASKFSEFTVAYKDTKTESTTPSYSVVNTADKD